MTSTEHGQAYDQGWDALLSDVLGDVHPHARTTRLLATLGEEGFGPWTPQQLDHLWDQAHHA